MCTHALVNRAKCKSHVYSRCSMTRGFDKPQAGTPMSHAGRGIRDMFHTACGARLYNIPFAVRRDNIGEVDERMKSDTNCWVREGEKGKYFALSKHLNIQHLNRVENYASITRARVIFYESKHICAVNIKLYLQDRSVHIIIINILGHNHELLMPLSPFQRSQSWIKLINLT